MKQGIKLDKIFVFDSIRLNTQIITQLSLFTLPNGWGAFKLNHSLCSYVLWMTCGPTFGCLSNNIILSRWIRLLNLQLQICCQGRPLFRSSEIKLGAKALEVLSKVTQTPIASTSKLWMFKGGPIKKMVSLPPDPAHVPHSQIHFTLILVTQLWDGLIHNSMEPLQINSSFVPYVIITVNLTGFLPAFLVRP